MLTAALLSKERAGGRGQSHQRWIAGICATVIGLFCWGYFSAELIAPPPTPLLLDRAGQYLAQVAAPGDLGYGYWPVDDLPPRVVAATLSLEDRRFWSHPGVDPLAILRAFKQNFDNGRRISGASTLAMQVARMQDPGPRDFRHKLGEAATAFFLTLRYGRAAVLKQYLRLVPYGNGSHGIAHAARFYLDKPVADLSWAEIAFLAAIPQAPSRMNPLSFQARVAALARGHRILAALAADRVITAAEFSLANAQLDNLPLIRRQARPGETLHAIINLRHLVAADGAATDGKADPRVQTTINPDIQAEIDRLTSRYLERWHANGAEQVAVIVTKVQSGEVLAWLGSAGYYGSKAGAIDFARTERSPGSTLKPFIYALALDRGAITPSTPLQDSALDAGTIVNADRDYLGTLMPRQALANSRNVPAANLVKTMGLDETYLYLRLLGLHDDDRPAAYYGLSMAVGALPTSLEKLVRAYGALANDGVIGDLVWYQGQRRSEGSRVMSVDAARLITQFLADPSARLPSFPRMGSIEYPFPVAVKTGTSQGYRDAWTIAYSRDYLVGVWVGRADAGTMQDIGGAQSAAELARTIMLSLYPTAPDPAASAFAVPEHYQLQDHCAAVPADEDRIAVATTGGTASRRIGDGPICISRLPEWQRKVASADEAARAVAAPGDDAPPQSVRILSPQNNLRLIRNPELPADLASLALKVAVPSPGQATSIPGKAGANWVPTTQVLWYVDGKPFQLAAATETLRWPLQPGQHEFQARIPYSKLASAVVTIQVQ
ncbi:MAG TPA: transglycosylase domain-containing protein [Terriglobia bacterium]|nr:transglycosylase domain-containing protein [Terriglobia bacterium]